MPQRSPLSALESPFEGLAARPLRAGKSAIAQSAEPLRLLAPLAVFPRPSAPVPLLPIDCCPRPTPRPFARLAGLVLLAVLLGALYPEPAVAQTAVTDDPENLHTTTLSHQAIHAHSYVGRATASCRLELDPRNVNTQVMPDPARPKNSPTATFEVDYGNGFTPEAQAAFQRAVDIWATHIDSEITIRVDATFADLGGNTLGSAGTSLFRVTAPDGEQLLIGAPLLEAIEGQNINDLDSDITARFDSGRSDWHFGTGPAPRGSIDFTSVVLHELGHGLNFLGTMDVTGSEGSWGLGSGAPGVFDVYAQDGTGATLTDTLDFPDGDTGSIPLGDALTSGEIVFTGPSAGTGAEQTPTEPSTPRLYAPSSWDDGSSFSHLDEDTYIPGTPNALMTPRVNFGETVRLPGPVTCGMFEDMGWPLGPDCVSTLPVELVAFDATASGGSVTLTWTTTSETNNTGFAIEQRDSGAETFGEIGFVEGAGTTTQTQRYRFDAAVAEPGTYDFRLRQVDVDGTVEYSPVVTVRVQPDRPYTLQMRGPNPFRTETAMDLTVRSPQTTQATLYNTLGQRVATLFDGRVAPGRPLRLDISARGLTAGVYFVRIQGETFATTERLVVVR